MRLAILLGFLLPACCLGAADAPMVIPLKVESGEQKDGRDSRVFLVPVRCAGNDAEFTWNCGGWTIVSEGFAGKCGLRIGEDDESAGYMASDGKGLFLGKASADITFGERKHSVEVRVIRDIDSGKGITGVIGYDIARAFQWEMDPTVPSLTLREPGAPIIRKALATFKLKEDRENWWLTVKARNIPVDVQLLPQTSDIQAAPDLQKAWDVEMPKTDDVNAVRTRKLTGKRDYVELSPQIQELNCTIMLVGDRRHPELTPNAQSGLGQSLLNRFVYCVDPKRREFIIYSRITPKADK